MVGIIKTPLSVRFNKKFVKNNINHQIICKWNVKIEYRYEKEDIHMKRIVKFNFVNKQ